MYVFVLIGSAQVNECSFSIAPIRKFVWWVVQIFSLTVGDGALAVPVAELSVGTDQKLAVTLRDDLGKSPHAFIRSGFDVCKDLFFR